MSKKTTDGPCCSLVEKLGGRRLADLDKELCTHAHRSYRKMAVAYNVSKTLIERHKHQCLGVGAPLGVPRVPEVREPRGKTVKTDDGAGQSAGQGEKFGGTLAGTLKSVPETSARAPSKSRITLLDRTAHVVSQMSQGKWDSARDIPVLASAWGLHPQTIRDEVRVIMATRRLNRGDIEQREEESLAFYAWQVEDLQLTLLDCETADEKARVHARIAEVRARMDAIAIPKGGAVGGFNPADPRFTDAIGKYVGIVQDVLGDSTQVALRVADLDPSDVARVLRAAATRLDERMVAIATPNVTTVDHESA